MLKSDNKALKEELQQYKRDQLFLRMENRAINLQLKTLSDEIINLKHKYNEVNQRYQRGKINTQEYEYFKERYVQYQIEIESLTGRVHELENDKACLLFEVSEIFFINEDFYRFI